MLRAQLQLFTPSDFVRAEFEAHAKQFTQADVDAWVEWMVEPKTLGTFAVTQEPVLFWDPAHFANTQCTDCDEQYYDDGEPGMATCPNCGGCNRV